MAQALFDEHPLGEYLRDVGEAPFFMPGSTPDLEREIDPFHDFVDESSDEPQPEWRPRLLLELLEILQSIAPSTQASHSPSPFVERFKYHVISSSLLAPSLPAPHPGQSLRSIPGRLDHSRASSLETNSTHPIQPPDFDYGPLSISAVVCAVFASLGYPTLFFLSFVATVYLLYNSLYTTDTPRHDMTSSFNSLDDLMAANEMWESVVQDAVSCLESEERSLLHSTSGASLPPSPVRVSLHSCLQTTHTQCDNIRHLFSALTSPAELSQLSEMYAPPSPIKSAFVTDTNARPFSYPSPTSPNKPASPATPGNKRSTWSGSYSNLAYAGSPTSTVHRRREKHRSNVSDLFQHVSLSAPVTPIPGSPSIQPAAPGTQETQEEQADATYFSPQNNHFGAAALDLQRKRRTIGIDALKSPPPHYLTADTRSPRSARNSAFISTISSASKLTNAQPARHPLSFASLTYALQGALAAKRYACSHLLALRFTDEEDEGYWEDVRSVMGLLTSTLSDASSRLCEALDEAERVKLADQNPTPNVATFDDSEPEFHSKEASGSSQEGGAPRSVASSISFAPMPSHVSRFAAHVSAISSALEDARDHLDQCVNALKSDSAAPNPSATRRLRHVRSLSRIGTNVPASENDVTEAEESKALQAYERLRRELGLALRECERGRERLMEIVHPTRPMTPSDSEEEEDLPGLGHDASDESDKQDPTSPASDDEADTGAATTVVTAGAGGVDDASGHLLLTSSAGHLPMPGIEEVFEAETGQKAVFNRERSRLSREERIKISKARRESGLGILNASAVGIGSEDGADSNAPGVGGGVGGGRTEKWGPGGEVVQELKDVIWKVGERRRKMTVSGGTPPHIPPSLKLSRSRDLLSQTRIIEEPEDDTFETPL